MADEAVTVRKGQLWDYALGRGSAEPRRIEVKDVRKEYALVVAVNRGKERAPTHVPLKQFGKAYRLAQDVEIEQPTSEP